jgi:general L-amino acid transport system permease protein
VSVVGEQLPPPQARLGVVGWLRTNLFSSVLNSLVTIVLLVMLGWLAYLVVVWVVSDARWGVVTSNMRLFMLGLYPFEQAWRVWLSLALLSGLTGISAASYGGAPLRTLAMWLAAGQALLAGLAAVSGLGLTITVALLVNGAIVLATYFASLRRPAPRLLLNLAWLAILPVWMLLLQGIGTPLIPPVQSNLIGGLLLTFLLSIVGIVLSFPFGVLLALGRRSDMPAVKLLSTVYIEVVRGVPLVTLLFMAAIMLPLFLPAGLRFEHLYRAAAGITLFSAAYVAENVRGGLQAIPGGQIEAAHSIGLNSVQTNLYIVLPQALRWVIPANVGLFISLLKDTTLVAVAGTGLRELLGIGQAVLAQPQWFGAHIEVYIFISVVFFVMCYTLSQASYRLEATMGVGKR